jgi:mannose-6-phosphate isomerase-like protein (cupin superfamily)
MGYTVLRPEDQEFAPPSWRPEEPLRRIVEVPKRATLRHSRAHLWQYPPGVAGRRHKPVVQEEVFFVHEGTFTMELGDEAERFELPPRSIVVVEPGTTLKLKNESDDVGLIWIYGAPADNAAEILEE